MLRIVKMGLPNRGWQIQKTRAETRAIYAETIHQQLSRKEQEETGVTEDFIRLSIGLEDVEDIKEDIDQALRKAAR